MAEETVRKPTAASIIEFPQGTHINENGKTASAPNARYKQPGVQRTGVGAFLPTIQRMQQVWQNGLPPDLPETQLREMKKAFVSGVASLFQVFKFDLPEVSDGECKSYLKHLDEELAKHSQEVRQ
jgi:hypothetical protein